MKKTVIILIAGLTTVLFAAGINAAELIGVDIHGFISQGYLTASENDFTSSSDDKDFAFNEVGINFGKELTDNLRFGIQLFSRDFGEFDQNQIEIDWAFADYAFLDWLGVRLGQIKIPHGLYNETRDVDMLRNPIFLPASVYNDLSQDLYGGDIFLSLQGISTRDLYLSLQGIGLYGSIDLSAAGELSYQALYGTQKIDTNIRIGDQMLSAFSNQTGMDFPAGSIEGDSTEVDYKYASSLAWDSPWEGLRVGFSLDNINMASTSRFTQALEYPVLQPDGTTGYAAIPSGTLATVNYDKLENWVGSIEYTWNNLILMAEIIQTKKEYVIELPFTPEFILKEKLKSEPWGWYAGGALRLIDWFELGAYFSQTRNDIDVSVEKLMPPIDFYEEFNDICATARFDVNAYWAIKMEAHRFSCDYLKPRPENPASEDFLKQEDKWNTYIVKMTAAF
jgi:hypothetical protein